MTLNEGSPTNVAYWVCLLVNLTNGAKTTEIIVNTTPDRVLIEKNHQNKQSLLNIFVEVIKVGPFMDSKVADEFHRSWSKQSRGSASRMKKVLSILERGDFYQDIGAAHVLQSCDAMVPRKKVKLTIIPYSKAELTSIMLAMKSHTPICVRKNTYDIKACPSYSTTYQLCANLAPIGKIQNHATTKLDHEITRRIHPRSRKRTKATNGAPRLSSDVGRTESYERDLNFACNVKSTFRVRTVRKNNELKTRYQPKLVVVKQKRNRCHFETASLSPSSLPPHLPNQRSRRQQGARESKRRKLEPPNGVEVVCPCEFKIMYPTYCKLGEHLKETPTDDGVLLVEEFDNLFYSLGDMTIEELSHMNM